MLVHLRHLRADLALPAIQLGAIALALRLGPGPGSLAALAVLLGTGLFGTLRALRHARLIADTPTARIASAAQGYTELRGRGAPLDGTPLLSPVNALPVLWYRLRIERRQRDGKWQAVSTDTSEASFRLDDGSARCVVDVEGAEILTRHKETRTQGNTRTTEWTLLADDAIYALGEFRSIGGSTQQLDAQSDVKALLAEMKNDQAKLLARFDLDGDGRIDMSEWALARQAARREIEKQHRAARNETDVHTLRCPSAGQLYLISNLDPDKIARRYLYWTAFHLATFFAALGALPWIWQQTY